MITFIACNPVAYNYTMLHPTAGNTEDSAGISLGTMLQSSNNDVFKWCANQFTCKFWMVATGTTYGQFELMVTPGMAHLANRFDFIKNRFNFTLGIRPTLGGGLFGIAEKDVSEIYYALETGMMLISQWKDWYLAPGAGFIYMSEMAIAAPGISPAATGSYHVEILIGHRWSNKRVQINLN